MKYFIRVSVSLILTLALFACATSAPQTTKASLTTEKASGVEQPEKKNLKWQKVILMGKVIDEKINFGDCPHNIVVNVLNKNGSRSKNAKDFSMNANAVSQIMKIPANAKVNISGDVVVNGFQTLVDEKGYFYICDFVSLDSTERVAYEFDRYFYMDKCGTSISVGFKGAGTTTYGETKDDGSVLKIYFHEIERLKGKEDNVIINIDKKLYDKYLLEKKISCE